MWGNYLVFDLMDFNTIFSSFNDVVPEFANSTFRKNENTTFQNHT